MATVGVKGLSSGGRSTGSVYVRIHADEELRQRMCSHTDEFCETVETLLEMHQSRLMTSLSAAALITTDDTNLMSPADTHYHVGSYCVCVCVGGGALSDRNVHSSCLSVAY